MEVEANATVESLLAMLGWALWAFVGVAALFYFLTSYLFEILAQKQDEPRWMAWVPLLNGWLMLRLVGWGRWYWWILGGYALGALAMLLPGALKMIALLAVLPLALGMLVLGLVYFPVLATRRGLGVGVGLWMVVPQFFPPIFEASLPGTGVWLSLGASVAALVAFFRIVFHDGPPKAWPHPVGWALTLAGVLVTGLGLQALPGMLADHEDIEVALAQLAEGLESGSLGDLAALQAPAQETREALSEAAPARSPFDEPAPVETPDTCPPDARERSEPTDTGRAWWCETLHEGRWVRHGPARTWHDNGYLHTEGLYDHGRRTGTWTRYWRFGGRRVQAEFADDVQDGWMHRWDADGRLETAVRYVDGEVASL